MAGARAPLLRVSASLMRVASTEHPAPAAARLVPLAALVTILCALAAALVRAAARDAFPAAGRLSRTGRPSAGQSNSRLRCNGPRLGRRRSRAGEARRQGV